MIYKIKDYPNLQALFDAIPADDMDVCVDGDYGVYDLTTSKLPAPINNRRITIQNATFKVANNGHGIRPHDSVTGLSADHSWAGGGIAAMLQFYYIRQCNFYGGGPEHTQLTIAGAHVGSVIEKCRFGNGGNGNFVGLGTPSKHLQVIFGMGVRIIDNTFQFARHDGLVVRSGQSTVGHTAAIEDLEHYRDHTWTERVMGAFMRLAEYLHLKEKRTVRSKLVFVPDDGPWFTDLSGGNSMSNNCIIENNRFFAQPNQQFDVRVMGSDMVEMRGNVHEGSNAYCRVFVHGQGSPNVNSVQIHRYWGEGPADRAQIYVERVPTVEIGTILSQHRSNLIETNEVDNVVIDNISHMQAGHTPWFVNHSARTKYLIYHAKQGRGILSNARWAGQNTQRTLLSPEGINAAGAGSGFHVQRGISGARVLFGGEIEVRNLSGIRVQQTFPIIVRIGNAWKTISNWWL